MSNLIAIDPGVTGAVAVQSKRFFLPGMARGSTISTHVFDTPIFKLEDELTGKNESQLIFSEMARLLAPYRQDAFALVERQTVMKKDGPNMTALVESFGAWEMALAILQIPFVRVWPAEWKVYFWQTTHTEKEQSVILARVHFPELADQIIVSKDGRADALCQLRYLMENEKQCRKVAAAYGQSMQDAALTAAAKKSKRTKK